MVVATRSQTRQSQAAASSSMLSQIRGNDSLMVQIYSCLSIPERLRLAQVDKEFRDDPEYLRGRVEGVYGDGNWTVMEAFHRVRAYVDMEGRPCSLLDECQGNYSRVGGWTCPWAAPSLSLSSSSASSFTNNNNQNNGSGDRMEDDDNDDDNDNKNGDGDGNNSDDDMDDEEIAMFTELRRLAMNGTLALNFDEMEEYYNTEAMWETDDKILDVLNHVNKYREGDRAALRNVHAQICQQAILGSNDSNNKRRSSSSSSSSPASSFSSSSPRLPPPVYNLLFDILIDTPRLCRVILPFFLAKEPPLGTAMEEISAHDSFVLSTDGGKSFEFLEQLRPGRKYSFQDSNGVWSHAIYKTCVECRNVCDNVRREYCRDCGDAEDRCPDCTTEFLCDYCEEPHCECRRASNMRTMLTMQMLVDDYEDDEEDEEEEEDDEDEDEDDDDEY